MSLAQGGESLESDRLLLRRPHVDDATVYRQLWIERDPRVPPHRRISAEGMPTVEDIAAQIGDHPESGPRLLTVQRKGTSDVIGYCGITAPGDGSPDEPELAYELLRVVHNRGYATEAGEAVLEWADAAG